MQVLGVSNSAIEDMVIMNMDVFNCHSFDFDIGITAHDLCTCPFKALQFAGKLIFNLESVTDPINSTFCSTDEQRI